MNALGDGRKRSTEYGWVRIESTILMKMAFGRPYRRESVLVCKLRPFDIEPIFTRANARIIVGKIEKAELNLPLLRLPILPRATDDVSQQTPFGRKIFL